MTERPCFGLGLSLFPAGKDAVCPEGNRQCPARPSYRSKLYVNRYSLLFQSRIAKIAVPVNDSLCLPQGGKAILLYGFMESNEEGWVAILFGAGWAKDNGKKPAFVYCLASQSCERIERTAIVSNDLFTFVSQSQPPRSDFS